MTRAMFISLVDEYELGASLDCLLWPCRSTPSAKYRISAGSASNDRQMALQFETGE